MRESGFAIEVYAPYSPFQICMIDRCGEISVTAGMRGSFQQVRDLPDEISKHEFSPVVAGMARLKFLPSRHIPSK